MAAVWRWAGLEAPELPAFGETIPWPGPSMSFGLGGAWYRRGEALQLMSAKKRGDKSYDLFSHLAAAKPNAAAGNDWSCAASEVGGADQWLLEHPPGSRVDAGSVAWQELGEALKDALDAYNNGRLACARPRD